MTWAKPVRAARVAAARTTKPWRPKHRRYRTRLSRSRSDRRSRPWTAHSLLIQALVYLAAGVVSVPIAKRLGLGSVLGYLIAGVLVGPFAARPGGRGRPTCMRFAEFGVVILLFLIGLEVRPALLWQMRTTIFGLGGAQLVGTAPALGRRRPDARAGLADGASPSGLILAMSSTAIVLQSLEEKGLRQGPVGQAAFGVLLFQDLAVIPLFALLPLLARHGGQRRGRRARPEPASPACPAGPRRWPSWRAIAAVVIGGRYLTRPMFRFIAAARLREIFTASALLLVVAVAALMETGRPLAGPRRLPGRRGAGRERVPPRAGDRHRAVPRPAAGPLLHHRRRRPRPWPGGWPARC